MNCLHVLHSNPQEVHAVILIQSVIRRFINKTRYNKLLTLWFERQPAQITPSCLDSTTHVVVSAQYNRASVLNKNDTEIDGTPIFCDYDLYAFGVNYDNDNGGHSSAEIVACSDDKMTVYSYLESSDGNWYWRRLHENWIDEDISCICISNYDYTIATGSVHGTVTLYDICLTTLDSFTAYEEEDIYIGNIAVGANALITSTTTHCDEDEIVGWHMEDHTRLWTIQQNPNLNIEIKCSYHGTMVMFITNQIVSVWDTTTGERIACYPHMNHAEWFGDMVAHQSQDGKIQLTYVNSTDGG